MRRSVAIVSLFFAWLCANGAIWDVVQVVAWTRMFAGYTGSLSVRDALRETFDPAKPCDLCVVVAKAKAPEQTSTPQSTERATQKLTLACDSAELTVFVSPDRAWPEMGPPVAFRRVEPVPLPPPRA